MALIANTLKLLESSEEASEFRVFTNNESSVLRERTIYVKVYEQKCDVNTAITSVGSPGVDFVAVSKNYYHDGGPYARMVTRWQKVTDWSASEVTT